MIRLKLISLKLNLTSLIVVLFTLSGLFYVFEQEYQRMLFVASILVLLIKMLFVRKFFFQKKLLFLLYHAFLFSFLIDSILFGSVECIIYGVCMFLVFVIINEIFSQFGNINHIAILININIIFGIVLLLTCVITTTISPIMYKGILGNANTLGIAAGSLFVLGLAKKAECRGQSLGGSKFEWCYIAFAFFITLLSSCRTAFLGEILCLCLFLAYYLKNNKNHFTRRNIFVLSIALASLITFCYAYGIIDLSKLFLFNKQKSLIDRGANMGNGRFEYWSQVWNNTGLFETGQRAHDITTHNVYFGLINQFGKINGILFFLFVVEFVRRSLKYAFQKKNMPWRLLPALCSVYFFIVSMTENYMMTAPMVAMFITMPLVTNKNFALRAESSKDRMCLNC